MFRLNRRHALAQIASLAIAGRAVAQPADENVGARRRGQRRPHPGVDRIMESIRF